MFFTKMQGLGNDFVIIEDLVESYKDYSEIARRLCSRHFGVGADGILVVKKSANADSKMLIYNSDGTEAEMCGNGIRCFAKYLFDRGIVKKSPMLVETLDGIKKIELEIHDGVVQNVKVNMGKPELKPGCIPLSIIKDTIINEPLTIENNKFYITSMLLGVPHTIIFVDEINTSYIKEMGPKIEKSNYFPKGTNVNFVNVINEGEFTVRTWERGAGLTLACGTGACASLVACVLNSKTKRKAAANLPGGSMMIEWDEKDNVYMTGPASLSFTGEFTL